MFKKMLPWLIIVLVAITLIVFAAFILWNFLERSPDSNDPKAKAEQSANAVEMKKLSAKEISEMTIKIDDILTNLSTEDDFVKISFAFELDSEDAVEEFTLLDFKVKDIIIQTLSDLKPEDIEGSTGKDALSTTLMNKINLILSKGKVRHVNITNFVLTS